MTFSNGFEEADENGKVTARCDLEHLLVGYYRPRHVAGWRLYEIGGHTIAISLDTLARLEGKRLKLRKTRGHSDIWPHVLVAV
ncbi:MAG TPA: hypothetical protein VN281_22720 [Verrucomicrobiae bacterium]|jgi:hypothetical protein|nr:hypothetical protein [Verrucomicrobiae bacterium]